MTSTTCELDEIIKQNSNLVYSVCSKYQNYCDKEDLYQEGKLGLIDAYENFDKTKNVKNRLINPLKNQYFLNPFPNLFIWIIL